jgi:hypothetical protein
VINGTQQSPFNVVYENSGVDFGINAGGGLEYFMGDDISMSFEVLLHGITGEVSSGVVDFSVSFRFLPN